MLLSLTTTHRPATDLGFLLHKNPANLRTIDLPFGAAHVFYPEATAERCTASVLLEVDPVGLVRRRPGDGRGDASVPLGRYVNDRPYVASSFLSVALAKLFGTAMAGRSTDRPELAGTAIPLRAELPAVPCRGGEGVLRSLFEPLGYAVEATPVPLDERFPEWGAGPHLRVALTGRARVADLLTHLYVLLPVLDDDKHYWVGDDEVDKLLAKGGDWLAAHPARDLIVRRYLRHRAGLAHAAHDRLADEDRPDPAATDAAQDREEGAAEERISLATRRIDAVVAVLAEVGARRVVDLGCGEGRLLAALLADDRYDELVGVDVSPRSLAQAARRLRLDDLPERRRARIRLLQSSVTYRDGRLAGFDAATLLEVIEHVDPWRLPALERAVFGAARPAHVVVTTPNVEHNARFPGLAAGGLRHRDHRFEWTRAELAEWARRVAAEHGYTVRHLPIGPVDPEVGPPTQMAVFAR